MMTTTRSYLQKTNNQVKRKHKSYVLLYDVIWKYFLTVYNELWNNLTQTPWTLSNVQADILHNHDNATIGNALFSMCFWYEDAAGRTAEDDEDEGDSAPEEVTFKDGKKSMLDQVRVAIKQIEQEKQKKKDQRRKRDLTFKDQKVFALFGIMSVSVYVIFLQFLLNVTKLLQLIMMHTNHLSRMDILK